MATEIGEYLVGAYLQLVKHCDFIIYNVRHPGGHLAGLQELDVVGLDFKGKTAYLCEATTHTLGLVIGSSYDTTVTKMSKKHANQRVYANNHLPDFSTIHFMFWSPVVPSGLAKKLQNIDGLELVINENYADCVGELEKLAKKTKYDIKNPAFRMLQILCSLRRRKSAC